MAAPNIGHSVIRVVNFFVVVLLVFILINLLAQPIISAIPSTGQNVSAIIGGLWQGVKDTVTSAAAGNNTAAATNAAATPTVAPVRITDPFTRANLDVEVAPGARITVQNPTGVPHTVMAVNGSFGSVLIPANGGSGIIIAPNSPGRYTYYVDNNVPSTTGTLTVRSVR